MRAGLRTVNREPDSKLIQLKLNFDQVQKECFSIFVGTQYIYYSTLIVGGVEFALRMRAHCFHFVWCALDE